MKTPSRECRRLGLSLRELLALVAFVAVACAALKFASYIWLTLVASVAFVCFSVAIILAIFQRGPQQAFAIGFAVMGIGYLVLVFYVWEQKEGSQYVRWYDGALGTTELLELLYGVIAVERPARNVGGLSAGPVMIPHPEHQTYLRVGQTLWSLTLAYLGGRFARFVWQRRAEEASRSVQ